MYSRAWPRWFLLFLLLTGSGCSTTLFASLPEGQVTHCDPAWPGRWRSDNGGGAFEISADCRTLTTLETGKEEREPVQLTLVSSATGQFVSYQEAGHGPECIRPGQCGYSLYRYVRNGSKIALYEIDHAWAASAIAAGLVPGHSERSEDSPGQEAQRSASPREPTYQNLVAGDSRQISMLLREHSEFFTTTPFLTLRRDEASTKGDQQP